MNRTSENSYRKIRKKENPDHGADQEKSGPRNPDLYREILEWVNRNGMELSKF